jgi:hypothetical protein
LKTSFYIVCFIFIFFHAKSQILWDSACKINGVPVSFFHDTIDNKFYMAGKFDSINGKYRKGIAVYNGAKWDSLGMGINGLDIINPMAHSAVGRITRFNNKIITCGNFASLGNVSAFCLGMWDGVKWDTFPGNPFKLKYESNAPYSSKQIVGDILVNGTDMYVAGCFDTVAGNPCKYVAKWDGSQWHCLNFPNMTNIFCVGNLAWYHGELYAGGVFENNSINDTSNYILKYDGQNWTQVGGGIRGGGNNGIDAMVVYNNLLIVAGWFRKTDGNAGDNIMAWNGSQWLDIGGTYMSGNGTVYQLLTHKNKLTALGVFDHAYTTPSLYIADFDGYSWCGYGTNFDNTILGGGYYEDTLIIGGGFKKINSDSITYIAKTKGGSYSNCSQFFSVNEIAINKLLNVFPNPASNSISLNIEGVSNYQSSVITIQNTLGQTVKKLSFTKNVDVADLPQGCYFIQVTLPNNETYKAKFVKE